MRQEWCAAHGTYWVLHTGRGTCPSCVLGKPSDEPMAATIARLTAENARMRSTLDKIASGYLSVSSECLWCMRTIGTHANDCASVLARRALADADTGEGRG